MARLAGAEHGSRPALVLIDAAPEQSHWPRRVWLRSALTRTIRHLLSLRGRSPRSAVAEITHRTTRLLIRLRRRDAKSGSVPKPRPLSTAASPVSSAQARLEEAFDHYEPTFYPGRIILLESAASALLTGNLPDIWRPLTVELERHRLPGDHLDLTRSTVSLAQLTTQLNASLGLAPSSGLP